MKLFWCPRTRAARAAWMLEELGLEYERELVDIRCPDARTPEFLAASPMGKVPAIVDGDVQIAESAAICLYLADKYAAGTLAPTIDDPQRGDYLFWMLFTPSVIEPSMAEKISGAKPNRGQHGWGDFATMIATWEAGLGDQPWILGEQFCAADVMIGSSAVFLKMFNMLPASEILEAYAVRCLERPAYQRVIALENAAAV